MIPSHLKEIIDYVAEYVGNSTDDWFLIKKELINAFPPKERSRFSKRHYSTKKHMLNQFDLEVKEYWENSVGIELKVDQNKLHPADWVRRPRGWALKEYHEKRRREKTTVNN